MATPKHLSTPAQGCFVARRTRPSDQIRGPGNLIIAIAIANEGSEPTPSDPSEWLAAPDASGTSRSAISVKRTVPHAVSSEPGHH